ncbi:hypothetical protein [Burkholderia gladioli]|uniref:hypothetical protein n=1 Tax=Burkholderia gladioli TaxID=28095 RepID=UPI000D0024AD|nr:hypothetical protein [Burkholderia gladioli]MDN7742234.1 hypothetical protein [Burkholderia gladioli]PRE92858.1 hypothetical protein C6Q13_00450 [Burkholderia gladioli]
MPHRQMMTARHLMDRTEACFREYLADAERSSNPSRKQMYLDFANGAFVLWNRLMQDLTDPADPLATAEFEADQARLDALFGDTFNLPEPPPSS